MIWVDLILVYYYCGWTDPATTTMWTNLESLRRLCDLLMIFVIMRPRWQQDSLSKTLRFPPSFEYSAASALLGRWWNRFVGRCLHWLTCLFGQRWGSPPCSVQVDATETDGRHSFHLTGGETRSHKDTDAALIFNWGLGFGHLAKWPKEKKGNLSMQLSVSVEYFVHLFSVNDAASMKVCVQYE